MTNKKNKELPFDGGYYKLVKYLEKNGKMSRKTSKYSHDELLQLLWSPEATTQTLITLPNFHHFFKKQGDKITIYWQFKGNLIEVHEQDFKIWLWDKNKKVHIFSRQELGEKVDWEG